MRVLVTGGAGYIGAVTAQQLVESGAEVTVLDDLSAGSRGNVPPAAELVVGDVGDSELVVKLVTDRRFEACVHFAASIEVGESMRYPELYFANNTAATLRLVEALVKTGCGRFLLSSTAAVYGEPHYTPIDEDHPVVPTNAYGESKLLIERALGWMADRGRVEFAALRYFNAAGAAYGQPELHDPETHLIPLALDAASGARGPLTVFGTDYPTDDGTCVRDYIHIADLARAHVLAVEKLGSGIPRAMNLGTGTGFTVRQVLDAVEQVVGRPVPANDGDRRAGDPAVLVASNDRARAALGWEPTKSLQEMVASAHEARGSVRS
jgi:UDP-glucose 4-epimerase